MISKIRELGSKMCIKEEKEFYWRNTYPKTSNSKNPANSLKKVSINYVDMVNICSQVLSTNKPNILRFLKTEPKF